MPRDFWHVRRWHYMVYVSPPACYHRKYVTVFHEWIPIPHEQVQYGCLEESISLHILGTWTSTKAGADYIHLLDTVTTRNERARTRGWGDLRQSWPSWYQGCQDWCLDGDGTIGRRGFSKRWGVKQGLMWYAGDTSSARSSLKDGQQNTTSRRMKRGWYTQYPSMVPGMTQTTALCCTKSRTAALVLQNTTG